MVAILDDILAGRRSQLAADELILKTAEWAAFTLARFDQARVERIAGAVADAGCAKAPEFAGHAVRLGGGLLADKTRRNQSALRATLERFQKSRFLRRPNRRDGTGDRAAASSRSDPCAAPAWRPGRCDLFARYARHPHPQRDRRVARKLSRDNRRPGGPGSRRSSGKRGRAGGRHPSHRSVQPLCDRGAGPVEPGVACHRRGWLGRDPVGAGPLQRGGRVLARAQSRRWSTPAPTARLPPGKSSSRSRSTAVRMAMRRASFSPKSRLLTGC